jgi:hypothetical protein
MIKFLFSKFNLCNKMTAPPSKIKELGQLFLIICVVGGIVGLCFYLFGKKSENYVAPEPIPIAMTKETMFQEIYHFAIVNMMETSTTYHEQIKDLLTFQTDLMEFHKKFTGFYPPLCKTEVIDMKQEITDDMMNRFLAVYHPNIVSIVDRMAVICLAGPKPEILYRLGCLQMAILVPYIITMQFKIYDFSAAIDDHRYVSIYGPKTQLTYAMAGQYPSAIYTDVRKPLATELDNAIIAFFSHQGQDARFYFKTTNQPTPDMKGAEYVRDMFSSKNNTNILIDDLGYMFLLYAYLPDGNYRVIPTQKKGTSLPPPPKPVEVKPQAPPDQVPAQVTPVQVPAQAPPVQVPVQAPPVQVQVPAQVTPVQVPAQVTPVQRAPQAPPVPPTWAPVVIDRTLKPLKPEEEAIRPKPPCPMGFFERGNKCLTTCENMYQDKCDAHNKAALDTTVELLEAECLNACNQSHKPFDGLTACENCCQDICSKPIRPTVRPKPQPAQPQSAQPQSAQPRPAQPQSAQPSSTTTFQGRPGNPPVFPPVETHDLKPPCNNNAGFFDNGAGKCKPICDILYDPPKGKGRPCAVYQTLVENEIKNAELKKKDIFPSKDCIQQCENSLNIFKGIMPCKKCCEMACSNEKLPKEPKKTW